MGRVNKKSFGSGREAASPLFFICSSTARRVSLIYRGAVQRRERDDAAGALRRDVARAVPQPALRPPQPRQGDATVTRRARTSLPVRLVHSRLDTAYNCA
jgi:hypothetical protein